MAQSFQKEKPPARINLFLEVMKGDAKAKLELPHRMLVTGDFKGREDSTPLEEREPININKDNLESVMKSLDLALEFAVQNKLQGAEGEEMKVNLKFDDMKSFTPEEVAKQVPELTRLVAMRNLLQDLRNRVVSTAQFRKQLETIVRDKDALGRLAAELDQFVARDGGQGDQLSA
ncbi:MAG TPA: type VI secretion system contractile sheath small subunit [Rhodothermales bacterium]|nr:type VI secretion system contractile sheath small subunit [Rhodothermales bacterium]